MKKHISLIAALALPLGVAAQNLNPEVQVTNEYETRIGDVQKQGTAMSVPDSMLRFDYHFDYSVFDSPYKGAYEFSPYTVSITPSAGGYDGRKLWLRAGAGYTLRPELDMVWSAVDGKKAAVNVFARGQGFLGKYLRVEKGTFLTDRDKKVNGWDFSTVAGVDTRFNVGKSVLRAELAYDGLFTWHGVTGKGIGHAPYVSLRLDRDNPHGFGYYVHARYRYVNDTVEGWMPLQDHDILADMSISPYIGEGTRGAFGLKFVRNSWYLGIEAHPHATLRLGQWDIDAGLRGGWHSDNFGRSEIKYGDRFTISPDVTATWHLMDNHLDIYVKATGGNNMLGYWDYKTASHWYTCYAYADPRPIWEIADLRIGVKGYTGFGLSWDVRSGYRFMQDMPMWTVSGAGTETITYNECGIFHADLDLAWKNERVDVQGAVHYNWLPEGVGEGVFMPAAVRADLKASYNWMKRIYAGVSGDMSTERVAVVGDTEVKLPWYLDLGVWAEYKFNDRIGVWLKGTNLLNHEIRLSPVHCPYGPSVIAGITVSL